MRYTIFDIEADGLLDTITKIHCLSYETYHNGVLIDSASITDYSRMRIFLVGHPLLIGHNIARYDIPALEAILGVEVKNQFIDTLGLSWYLFPYRKKHGLEWWGEDFGVEKPVIAPGAWLGPLPDETFEQFIAKMIHRCEEDVKINSLLFHEQWNYLMSIYSGNIDNIRRLVGYLNFKLECLYDQEKVGISLNRELCEKTKLDLEFILEDKMDNLRDAMPQEVAKVLKIVPKKLTKKDGTPSAQALNWYRLLTEHGLPPTTEIVYEKPNPASPIQLKKWLTSLGWEPQTYKVSKATNEAVPQVSLPFGQGICQSVKALYEKAPVLEELDGFYVARHRLGLCKSFLDSVDENGFIFAKAHGFTNTLRLQHSKPVVNLPGVYKPYGKEIRGCLTVPSEEYIMCGSDISGLEDNTKQHYIFFFDPDYVTEMRTEGFDPHIDIALVAKMITEEDAEFFKAIEKQKDELGNKFKFVSKEDEARYKTIKNDRTDAKVVNFSATYGAGPAKIAETLKKPFEAGKALHTTYWERNKAVKQTADACLVKTFNRQKWLYNPTSGFWMFLKEDKDKFSTLNQSTGVYVFDSWVRKCKGKLAELSIKICMQYHDELLLWCKAIHKEAVTKILNEAMDETNTEVNLNVKIGISVDWGKCYADCH